MVNGLDLFSQHFAAYNDQYVLIGGAACTLAMEDVGQEFRATKDLDIVLCVESLNAGFASAFWEFVRYGDYQLQEKSTGKKQFYRFQKPTVDRYPFMLELFSRVPDSLAIADESHLTPIPFVEEISSLSAILIEPDYYKFILNGKRKIGDASIVGPEHLIPLKAKAWLDMTERSADGPVDSRDLKKHKNDVFRLLTIVAPDFKAPIPPAIQSDVARFANQMEGETIALKSLGLGQRDLNSVLAELRQIYGIEQ